MDDNNVIGVPADATAVPTDAPVPTEVPTDVPAPTDEPAADAGKEALIALISALVQDDVEGAQEKFKDYLAVRAPELSGMNDDPDMDPTDVPADVPGETPADVPPADGMALAVKETLDAVLADAFESRIAREAGVKESVASYAIAEGFVTVGDATFDLHSRFEEALAAVLAR